MAVRIRKVSARREQATEAPPGCVLLWSNSLYACCITIERTEYIWCERHETWHRTPARLFDEHGCPTDATW